MNNSKDKTERNKFREIEIKEIEIKEKSFISLMI